MMLAYSNTVPTIHTLAWAKQQNNNLQANTVTKNVKIHLLHQKLVCNRTSEQHQAAPINHRQPKAKTDSSTSPKQQHQAGLPLPIHP